VLTLILIIHVQGRHPAGYGGKLGGALFSSRYIEITMISTPSTPNYTPADLNGLAGSGIVTEQAERFPAVLSPALKYEIQKIISQNAANGITFTGAEFRKFLESEQKV
jgi:hypothetical protein